MSNAQAWWVVVDLTVLAAVAAVRLLLHRG